MGCDHFSHHRHQKPIKSIEADVKHDHVEAELNVIQL